MNKTFGLIGLSVVLIAVLAMFTLAIAPVDFCSDSDGGVDVWTAGITTSNNGPNTVYNADDCDGASENLKEFYCDGDIGKLDNIKCTDFNAVCVSDGDKDVGDYCACPEGYTYSDAENTCVGNGGGSNGGDDDNNNVPVFPGATLVLAVVGAGLGLALLRKN